MEHINKIKPFIVHLNRQLKDLEPEIKKLTNQPLDDQLLSLTDEKERLKLSNKYAYVLSSLLFVYMKVLNVKDMTPIMAELSRVKSYMDKVKQLDLNQSEKESAAQEQQERAKTIIGSALGEIRSDAAISKVHFLGKHTKFENKRDQDELAKKVMSRLKQANKTKESTGKVSKRNK
ncbi:Lrp1p Ecym_8001 [Eremothecium cymbalariae DBVPG|uniref:Exosome complex protein n=1 Tax=Eremothecium cymbalariae (strain CBS 270.75 / DBVPG 7215 / KCTC 17166 / NRRL Y-17582) TaxID=931890 RepID=G8JXX1_ERECY|nr:Hypothetical protein Ecym_8001 [Eremothecium cymbalariae DBVPG\